MLRLPTNEDRSTEEAERSTRVSSTDEVLVKVRKLLALSQSSNEHEAALAAERAHALLMRLMIRLLRNHSPMEIELRSGNHFLPIESSLPSIVDLSRNAMVR
jgi:hypothetical protein